MHKKTCLLIGYSLAAAGLLYAIEQYIGVSYVIKTLCKVVLFLLTPLVFEKYILDQHSTTFAEIKALKLRDLVPGFFVGIFAFTIVIVAYVILGNYIDLTTISSDLENKLGITALNFIFIGLYITFVNSLLEEFFFRNFIFLNLYKKIPTWIATIFSSLLFAIYHMAIFKTWFSPMIIILALFGLFVIGLIFNYMNSKYSHFLNSWLTHIMADTAIILIGLRMFGII